MMKLGAFCCYAGGMLAGYNVSGNFWMVMAGIGLAVWGSFLVCAKDKPN